MIEILEMRAMVCMSSKKYIAPCFKVLRPIRASSEGVTADLALGYLPSQWAEVARRHAGGESLRQLAKLYRVSHEAVRQVLKR
jgi:hypothetical protein